MITKRVLALVLALMMTLTLFGCGEKPAEDGTDDAPKTVTITDMIGRQVEIVPGSYQRVVCIGAGALRLYSYVGDVSLLCGVEDIDNTTLEERPKMFDGVARPYVMVYGDTFAALPSCGVGGPNAQAAEAEKILSCTPDIIVSEYEDTDKAEALQQQVGVPVITLRTGVDGVFSEDFSGSITLLGQVFGKETRASELLAFVSTETADIQARTADIAEDSKPAVYICGLGNWGTTNHLMTIESYSTFTVANIKNTVSGLSAKGVQPIEAEKFTALGPDMDIMLIDAAAVKNIKPLYAEDNGLFDSCKAWQEGKVYLQMAYNAYYTNYEIALANAWFSAKCVYPEQFTDIDMTEKLNEITGAFLARALRRRSIGCPTASAAISRSTRPRSSREGGGMIDKRDVQAFFDRLAPDWDAGMVRNEAVIARILDNAGVCEGCTVLDVACGTGVLFGDYVKRGAARVTAVDLSPEMVARAAEKAAGTQITVVCGDVEDSAAVRDSGPYDVVMVYNAFPHFPDPAGLIRTLAELVRPGGRLSIAHGMSRAALDAHHSGSAKPVSLGLLHEDEVRALMAPYLDVDTVISNREMYQVCGRKRA